VQLVVLAAGKGVRLGDEAQSLPKSLVSIAEGVSYLSLQVKAFARFPFSQKLIVGGFAIDRLASFLAELKLSDWLLVNNQEFHKGNLYSLKAAMPLVKEDFFLFNADHFYSDENYLKILSHRSDHITIFCDTDRRLQDDDMKVLSQDDCLINMSKPLTDFDHGYVGITYVPASKRSAYDSAFSDTEREQGDSANVEMVLNRLAKLGEKVCLFDISGSWWTEIDTPEDLEKAKLVISAKMPVVV
jgi:choline kinase